MKRISPLPILALLFFGPFILAIVLYAGRGSFGGFDQLENPDRELIATAAEMPRIELRTPGGALVSADGLRSRWSLIYAKMPACEAGCTEALERLNQVYLALGTDRVQLVLLTSAGETGSLPPYELSVGLLDAADDSDLVALLGYERLEEGRYFVVDPLGNLILSYPADADQGRLLEDLERLLDVSRIG